MTVVLTFEQFAAENGASRFGFGEAALHRSSNKKSANTHRKDVDLQAEKDRELIARRDALRKEYKELVLAGKIKETERNELLIAIANGASDNLATLAAQRLLTKRGIDWMKRVRGSDGKFTE